MSLTTFATAWRRLPGRLRRRVVDRIVQLVVEDELGIDRLAMLL